ncbi:MYG1 family protein [Candidatus Nomurabacteria bacterium]|nr:MYG1 family protein [Candidatus Nomurabacteria bacterium]
MMFSKKVKLATHDGAFHADEIFAAALLTVYLKEKGKRFEITRTRDEDYIKTADYVFDVGGIYNAEKNLFDHHQPGGAGRRENGIEYSSFGLIWKKIGTELCGSEKVAEMIDKKLVAPIDANDNGFNLVTSNHEVSPYTIQDLFHSMRATWREETLTDDEVFFKCLEIAKEILAREIIQAKDGAIAEERVISIYNNTADKRIIVFDKNYAFQYDVENFPKPLFAVYPSRSIKDKWTAKAVRKDPKAFSNRKDFPKSWAGLRNEELQKVSGVQDAVFCHRNLFLAVAKSREGAIKLAQTAIES